MSSEVAAVEVPPMECPAVMLPTPANMKNMTKQLAAMPAKLGAMMEVQAATMAQEEVDKLTAEADKLKEVVEQILDVIDAPNFESIEWPDLRGEIGIDKLFQKYPIYLQVKMIELITKIISITVEVPVPPLPISVDIVKFVTDEDYKSKLAADLTGMGEDIKAQIAALDPEALGDTYMDEVNKLKGGVIDPLYDLLPAEWQSFGGEEGFEISELKGQAIIAFLESKMSGLGVGMLFDAFAGLISKFDIIWDALGLPDLPIPLSLDVGSMISAIVDAEKAKFTTEIEALDIKAEAGELTGEALIEAKTAAFDTMSDAMTEGLEGLSIAGFPVMELIGGPIDDPVECLALKKKRICEEIGRFKDNWQFYLLRKWMEIVTSFFDAIGLGAITQWVGCDFCTFLGIIGFPKSIDLSFSDHIKEVENKVVSSLPKGIESSAEDKVVNNITTTEGQTTITGSYTTGNVVVVNKTDLETEFTGYSISSGNIVLNTAAAEGDEYLVIPT